MAKPSRQPSNTQPGRTVKVQAVLDVGLYARLAAGAALRGTTHSAFVVSAIEKALSEDGVYVGRRRGSQGNLSAPVDSIGDEAA